MIIQIYEIQTPWEAEKCIKVGVDHIGSVILSQEEWRVPDVKTVVELAQGAGKKSSLIFLFSDDQTIFKALDYYRPNIVHFCESLTDHTGKTVSLHRFLKKQESIKRLFPEIQIMRSIPIAPESYNPRPLSLEIAQKFEPVTDFFLTDTWLGKEPVEGFIGITGRVLDWNIAAQLVRHTTIPVILAGGLGPHNVYEALVKVMPAGADSCTGTNEKDKKGNPIRFKKDFNKVKQFVLEVRRAEQELRN
ncbi:MAG: hypothetical protein DRH12_06195 [Deltaproteobacteria bacterium]|nr:MAG: hypothetical protein DRH12_06195 [Deltaproteobacteria bacterium]